MDTGGQLDDDVPADPVASVEVDVVAVWPRVTTTRLPGMAVAAAASIGAGVIHAGAIGIHADHAALARAFVGVAVFQIGWGIVALIRPSRWLAAVGAAGNLAVVSAWLVTRLAGVSFIDGLHARETAHFTDTACALLGLVCVGLTLSAFLVGERDAEPTRLFFPALAVAALAVPALVAGVGQIKTQSVTTTTADAAATASTEHVHSAEGSATAGGGAAAAAAGASQPHVHTADGSTAVTTEGTGGTATATGDSTATTVHEHPATAVPTVPYDPTKPIDLGGVPGVTPEEQARAENLVAITIVRLPQWSDPKTAIAAGFESIGDGLTGFEHYINWKWIDDNDFLDPDHPESLVYATKPDGTKTLVSAMYMLPHTVALDQVPDIGGALTQWHIHDNLCFTKDPVAPKVAGLTDGSGNCPPSLQKFPTSPMIHVWITPNQCGPFAALEGVGAGQIAPGQTRLCDHAHGSSTGLLG